MSRSGRRGQSARRRVMVAAAAALAVVAALAGWRWRRSPIRGRRCSTAATPPRPGALRLIDPSKGQKCTSTQKAVTWGQPGVTWRGPWKSATSYRAQDAVAYQGSSYLAIKTSKGAAPASSTADWALLAGKGNTGNKGLHGERGPQGRPGPAGTELLPGQLGLGVGIPQVLSGATYDFGVPFGIAFDGTHLWISNVGGNAVTKVNDSDGSLAQVLSGASYGFNNPAEITSAGNHLWVVNENGNSVTAVQR